MWQRPWFVLMRRLRLRTCSNDPDLAATSSGSRDRAGVRDACDLADRAIPSREEEPGGILLRERVRFADGKAAGRAGGVLAG